MYTTIDVDDALLAEAMVAMGQSTREAAVEAALRQVVQLHRQKVAGDQMAGFGWEGDLDAMREGREF